MFFNGYTEIVIHRTFASPCNEITYADIDVATEIQSCNTRTSKIDDNKKQLESLCEASWSNITRALGKSTYSLQIKNPFNYFEKFFGFRFLSLNWGKFLNVCHFRSLYQKKRYGTYCG